MASLTPIKDILQRKQSLRTAPKVVERTELPVRGGRQTVPEGMTTMGGFLAEMSVVQPDFNVQLLRALEQLATYNPEVSMAVDNIVQLGNTIDYFPTNIGFDDAVSDEMQKEMIQRLKARSRDWYAYSGGINSMVNDLFAQIAINGSLSAEIVAEKDLSGVKKIVTVAPKNIKFKYDKQTDNYLPYQVNGLTGYNLNGAIGIELNPVTYKYIALRRFSEKPYGIPPFLSALENLVVSKDMSENMKYIIRKLGILGFLEVLVDGPKAGPNEDAHAYYKRSKDYLSDVVPEVEKGLAKGFLVGFKDHHEVNMQTTTQNVQGAKDLVEMNDTKLMAGLKQDPLMFGRNFSTTETLGRVVLAKMTSQVDNYQRLVARFMESAFLMDLQLAGYPVKTVEVEFDAPMVGDKLRDAQAREKELANLYGLYDKGIIALQQVAIEAGYEKPDQEEPRNIGLPPVDGNDPKAKTPAKDDTTKTKDDPKAKTSNSRFSIDNNLLHLDIAKFHREHFGDLPVYPYNPEGCNCGDASFSFAKGDDDVSYYVRQYYSATKDVYDKAVAKSMKTITAALSALGEGATEQKVRDVIVYNLFKDWGQNFTAKQKKVVDKFTNVMYRFFRNDKSLLKGIEGGIPEATFRQIDFRAIEYYKKSDQVYLGKFITDPDLKKEITQYIKEAYIDGRKPIGRNPDAMDDFREKFGTIMDNQDFKLRRIIDTTVNKMRNTAAVSYMDQAEVESYAIVGVNDQLQCGYCAAMQGMTFSIKKSLGQIDQMSRSQPELVGLDSPFVTSLFKKPEDMKGLSADDLQSKGIGLPAYHPHCRDQVIAVL